MSNAIYKKDLHDVALAVAQGSKDYTDKVAEEILWRIGDYDITTQTDSTTALVKTAPSGATRCKMKRIHGSCVKYAPSVASDDSVAKDKVIPEYTYEGYLNYIGGASKVSENEIVLKDVPETTYNGLTYKVENGVITVISGTAESNFAIYLSLQQNINLLANANYKIALFNPTYVATTDYVGLYINGSTVVGITHTTSANMTKDVSVTENMVSSQFCVRFTGGSTYSNFIIKPMLVKGSTAPTEFSVGFEGIRSAKTTSVVVSGNLLDLNDVPETTVNGVTYKIENGTVYVKGTWTGSESGIITLDYTLNQPAGSYTLSAFNNTTISTNTFLRIAFTTGNPADINLRNVNGQISFTSNYKMIRLQLRMGTFSSEDWFIFKPMLVKGTTAPTIYKPYVAPITKAIPSEILNNEYYGLGYDSTHYNNLDLINRNLIVEYKMLLAKNITWLGVNGFFQANVGAKATSNQTSARIISTNYAPDSADHIYNGTNDKRIGANADNGYLQVRDNDYTDATAFKNHFSDTDSVLIELRGQTIFDMSSYLDDSFKSFITNNNYTNVELINEYNYDMPNKLEYYGTIKETLCTQINKNNVLALSLTNNDSKYGWSVNDIYNTRDYTINKGSQKVGRVDMGTLPWVYDSVNQKFGVTGLTNQKTNTINILCNKYTTVNPTYSAGGMDDKTIATHNNTQIIYVKDLDYTDATTFKTAMSGVYLYYELATEIPENITPLDSNVIEVAPNDELEFVNSENQAVPSEITYRIEVVK